MFHDLTAEWFDSRFGVPTDCQARAWPELARGRDVLITAPTGSGKTLAAFLVCLDRLVRAGLNGGLPDRTEVLYISPLKALSNDIQRNLEGPLAELQALAASRGVDLGGIVTAVRTGDTPASERERMAQRPPHILVTTPESAFILLTSERGRRGLRGVRTVIVDEIHALVDDKRGSHLALTLARLDDLVSKAGGAAPQRIGLSATVKPLDEVAAYLIGDSRDRAARACAEAGLQRPQPPALVEGPSRRRMDLAVEVPRDELGPVASNEMWGEIHDRLAALIREHRTTIVFVNTRRLAERVAHHLADRLGPEAVLAHHGSLARHLRLAAEQRLKAGDLRAVVATASLELGIDIGSVDLVCQIGSPRALAVALQRVGRSGHAVERPGRDAVPKGRIFATTRDELLECAALVSGMRAGLLDGLAVPPWPLDVLAQQIVAMAACEEWSEDDLFACVRRAWPYRDLPRERFDAVLEVLSEGISTRRGRSGAYLHRDGVNGRVKGRRGARLAAITSGGAIPENASYLVVAEPDGAVVGTLDEDFAVESLAGDVFLLGTTSWRIRRVEPGRVRVENAHGAPPSVPFWRGEAPGRTMELSAALCEVRAQIMARLEAPAGEPSGAGEEQAARYLMESCGLDRRGAEQAAAYVRAGARALGALPSLTAVVAERFFDEGGGMQLVLHAPFGARLNRAWGLALRKRFCRSFNFELQAAATDNGIVISLSDQHSFPLELVFRFLHVASVEEVLTQAMLPAPMFTARWRWNASRALAVLRFAGGRKVPPPLQRMRSDDLLAAVFPDQVACPENLEADIRIPDHPLVFETIRDCLHEAMDLEGLKALLERIESGGVRAVAIGTAEPSPFSHEILNANPYAYLDDAPLEERRTRAVQMRRSLGDDAARMGALDPAAIAEVASQAWPVVRDPDELHDALLTLGVLPPVLEWEPLFRELSGRGRAGVFQIGGTALWVAAERCRLAATAYPGASVPPLGPVPGGRDVRERAPAVAEILRGWLECTAPLTVAGFAERVALPPDVVHHALLQLESEGQVLRGRFSTKSLEPAADVEWCNRRLLARIHRLTLGRLRREIEPVTAGDFARFLARWQHLAPGTLLHGVDGLLQVIKQLQGYEVSAGAWESRVLKARVANYGPELLDRLCLSGEVMWARLSRPGQTWTPEDAPRPAERAGPPRRRRPTRVAPLALFLRQDSGWLLSSSRRAAQPSGPAVQAHAGAVLEAIGRRGALFASEVGRLTGLSDADVEEALWGLAAAGLVTADGFGNLRGLLSGSGRDGADAARRRFARRPAGRWAPIHRDEATTAEAPVEVEFWARQLLARWGVVFRDVLARETLAPAWRDLLVALRRLEARGEVRGGRFVAGFVGEQFALPEAVELLRHARRDGPHDAIEVAAADPLNLAGIVLPGPRVSPVAGSKVKLVQGDAPRDGMPRPAGATGSVETRH